MGNDRYYDSDADRIASALWDISQELVNLRQALTEVITGKCKCESQSSGAAE